MKKREQKRRKKGEIYQSRQRAHMKKRGKNGEIYQSQVSFLGPVGYGLTTLPLRHFDV
jgi:hypothetical protein